MKHLLLSTIAAVLLVGCAKSVSIHETAEAGNIEAVKQQIANGADVNAKDKYGRTTLHAAAVGGSKEVVELLIAKGADVNAKYEECATSLDWAKNQETADLLRKHGGKTWKELKAEGK